MSIYTIYIPAAIFLIAEGRIYVARSLEMCDTIHYNLNSITCFDHSDSFPVDYKPNEIPFGS